MAGFKDFLDADLEVFFDTEVFAEEHDVDGVVVPIIIDNDLLKERQSKMTDPDGYHTGDLLFHVKAEYFANNPKPGRILKLDQKSYRVADVLEDGGVYAITLAANLS